MDRRSFLKTLLAASATTYFLPPIGGWHSDVINQPNEYTTFRVGLDQLYIKEYGVVGELATSEMVDGNLILEYQKQIIRRVAMTFDRQIRSMLLQQAEG